MCGELQGLLPCIERDATIQIDRNNNIKLTKDELENKQWLYKDAYQKECGPISLSEIFYKLEDGILGRNSQIKQEHQITWKTVEFIQKKFSKEWHEIAALNKQNDNDNNIIPMEQGDDISDIESDVDEQELKYKYDPSFRALIDLDKKIQIEKKMKIKYPQNNHNKNVNNGQKN
eukprot:46283_1